MTTAWLFLVIVATAIITVNCTNATTINFQIKHWKLSLMIWSTNYLAFAIATLHIDNRKILLVALIQLLLVCLAIRITTKPKKTTRRINITRRHLTKEPA